jgi:quercetin dioxygenase-like cupin family protein
MKRCVLGIVVVGCMAISLSMSADTKDLITIASEPHHHLLMHNDYVNVYHAQLLPNDSMLLHTHAYTYTQVAMGDAHTVRIVPGQPDLARPVHDGQVDYGAKGATHSSRNDGTVTYNTIAVEFLHPQNDIKNGCVAAIAAQTLNCVDGDAPHGKLQFETDNTRIYSTVIPPHQSIKLRDSTDEELIVAVDHMKITGGGAARTLKPGDFAWIEKGTGPREIKNTGDKDLRFAEMLLKP